MTGFLRLELARSFRDPRYLVLAIAAPVGFYLLFAGIFTGRGTSEGQLPAQVEIMVAMATFGAMWGALSSPAPGSPGTRESGWLRALEVTPLTAGRELCPAISAGRRVREGCQDQGRPPGRRPPRSRGSVAVIAWRVQRPPGRRFAVDARHATSHLRTA
ncbi:MAG: type transporter [Actinomycetia bacterium]|nr:type transporter [Actinomycetes bacterium]